MPGMVHVNGYQQRRHGLLVDVADYERGGGGSASNGSKKPWHGTPNQKFREEFAKAERSAGKLHDGYREQAKLSNALGRYQLTPGALDDIGWRHRDGTWTEDARTEGATSDREFLENPAAQETAMSKYMKRNEKQLASNGSYRHLGRSYVENDRKTVRVTRPGLAAAAHREGAGATKRTLDKLAKKRAGNPQEFDDHEQNVITRLRNFREVPFVHP